MDTKTVINSYRDLVVWQEAMSLAEAVYRTTASFPRDEVYGLTSQIKRAGASVPANIAEGYGRDSKGAYVQQLRVAQGSLKELETHLILAQRVRITDDATAGALLNRTERVGKMLRSLIRSLDAPS